MLVLYQFPISHYCEKVRWALAHKKLEYQQHNLVPGSNVGFSRKHDLPASTVPILRDAQVYIQGSSEILDYLDAKYKQSPLTPANQSLKEQAVRWERYVDEEVGVHLRRYFYSGVLQYPKVAIPLLAAGLPWYSSMYLRLIFPAMRKAMIRMMKITDGSAACSLEKVNQAVNLLAEAYAGSDYLVGDEFTRADLAAASLLAPVCRPAQYGVNWPETLPQELQLTFDDINKRLAWVLRMYRDHR